MNFTEWSKNNPDKSLNDFYRENALAAELQKSKNESIYEPPSSSSFWSVLTIALSLFIGGFLLFAYQKYNEAEANNRTDIQGNQLFVSSNEVERHAKFEHDQRELSVNWKDLITVEQSGGEQLGLTGGFRDVNIIVTNKTEYPVDEVTVMIRVMGIWGRVCHSRMVTLDNIASFDNGSSQFTYTGCGQTMAVDIIGFKCNALKYTLNHSQ